MSHVARAAAESRPVLLVTLLFALGCARPPEDLDALLEESRALRSLAWDAHREASRALLWAELAEQDELAALAHAEHSETLAAGLLPLPSAALEQPLRRADLVRVRKRERLLELYRNDELLGVFRVALGFEPEGHKERQGDGRTPEGTYTVDGRHVTARYGRALHISYPSPEDVRRAQAAGVSAGGGIFIHGLPTGLGFIGSAHARLDWTNGCIAVTNEELEEILARVSDGVTIEILP